MTTNTKVRTCVHIEADTVADIELFSKMTFNDETKKSFINILAIQLVFIYHQLLHCLQSYEVLIHFTTVHKVKKKICSFTLHVHMLYRLEV